MTACGACKTSERCAVQVAGELCPSEEDGGETVALRTRKVSARPTEAQVRSHGATNGYLSKLVQRACCWKVEKGLGALSMCACVCQCVSVCVDVPVSVALHLGNTLS